MKFKIRPAEKSDLKKLNKYLFVKSIPDLHEKKLEDQEKGNSFWLIGWIDNKPIAHLQLRLKKSKEKNCAHIESLGVKKSHRKKGVGKKLMGFAESLAKKKGFKKVGLAVEINNQFLRNMYEKQEYQNWGKGIIIETWEEVHNGKKKKIIEKCKYLIKKLK